MCQMQLVIINVTTIYGQIEVMKRRICVRNETAVKERIIQFQEEKT